MTVEMDYCLEANAPSRVGERFRRLLEWEPPGNQRGSINQASLHQMECLGHMVGAHAKGTGQMELLIVNLAEVQG